MSLSPSDEPNPMTQQINEERVTDIADLRAREIYEIKHYKSERYGRNELWWYLSFLPGYGPGSRQYPTGIRRIGDWPAPYNRTYDVIAWIDNGVILYKGRYKGQNIKDVVTAVCLVGAAAVAGKNYWIQSKVGHVRFQVYLNRHLKNCLSLAWLIQVFYCQLIQVFYCQVNSRNPICWNPYSDNRSPLVFYSNIIAAIG
jgi:hypothetical protein